MKISPRRKSLSSLPPVSTRSWSQSLCVFLLPRQTVSQQGAIHRRTPLLSSRSGLSDIGWSFLLFSQCQVLWSHDLDRIIHPPIRHLLRCTVRYCFLYPTGHP